MQAQLLGLIGNDCELVACIAGAPPDTCGDDGEAKYTEGCTARRKEGTKDRSRKKEATKDHSAEESSSTKMCMKLEIIKGAADTGPDRSIKFVAGSNVLAKLGEGVEAAFQSQSSEECLELLPSGRLKDKILALTGRPGRKRIKLNHIEDHGTELVFEIVLRKNLGVMVGTKDHLLIESIDPTSLTMRSDYDAKIYTGLQEASFAIVARDLHDIGSGALLVSPSYWWPDQYVKHISTEDLKRLYYDQPLHGLAHDGTKQGDVLEVHDSSDSTSESSTEANFRENSIITAYSKASGDDDVAMCGAFRDFPVRVQSGISFTFDHWPHTNREMVSGYGNPCLCVCHGFVAAIAADADGETVLAVRLALARGNLPPFLKWRRMNHHSLLQTNLNVVVPAKCVTAVFQIKPLCLHDLARGVFESRPAFGAHPIAFDRDPYVLGHLHFDLGPFQMSDSDSEQRDGRANDWMQARSERYVDNDTTMAFALLSDFCARGSTIVDQAFKEHHGRWKEKYCKEMTTRQGGRHIPKAKLFPIVPFPADQAVRQIHESARHLQIPRFNISLQQLRTAFKNFALSKTKPTSKAIKAVVFNPTISGSVLLQLVHAYSQQYTSVLREGAVEAVVDRVESAIDLIGNPDGTFNLEEHGIVTFFGPITFRWVLFDAKKPAPGNQTESAQCAEGRAEVTFRKFVAKDRHGADVAGAVHEDEDAEQGGAAGPEGGMTPLDLKVHPRQKAS